MKEILTVVVSALMVILFTPEVDGSGALLTSGLPSCYVHSGDTHGIPGLYNVCPSLCNTDSGDNQYVYCSKDQYCCWNNGCYACCVLERSLTGGEIAGIIIGVIVFAAILLGLILWISFKFFSKKQTA